jgi:hypothetical protein
MLPETVTQKCVLPLSDNRLAAARLLRLVLADANCGPVLQSVLGWQGSLRSMLSDLLSLRQRLLQVRHCHWPLWHHAFMTQEVVVPG